MDGRVAVVFRKFWDHAKFMVWPGMVSGQLSGACPPPKDVQEDGQEGCEPEPSRQEVAGGVR